MEISSECRKCVTRWVYDRTAPHLPEQARPRLLERIRRAVEKGLSETTNMGFLCNCAVFSTREFGPGASGYYEEFKQKSNEQARALGHLALSYIEGGSTERQKFERACILAAAGNVAPLSAPSATFTFQEVMDIIEGRSRPVVEADVYEAVRHARRVFYVTDNAGEVGFDMFLLKAIKKNGPHVTLVVKDDIFFEDATAADACYFNLEQVVDEIVESKGFFVRRESSSAAGAAFDMCDLVIAKGTGSFEGLKNETAGKTVVFMLKVKCGPIGRHLNVEDGRIVVRLES